MVEEGGTFRRSDFSHLDWLDATRLLYRDMGLSATLGAPPVLVPMGRGVGGTTLINLGTALRMDASMFEYWIRSGVGSLSYSDLVAVYDQVEELMPLEPIPEDLIGENSRILTRAIQDRGYPVEWLTRYAHGCQASGRCYAGCPVDAKKSIHLTYVPEALAAGARLVTRCRIDRITSRSNEVDGVSGWFIGLDGSRKARVTIRAPRVVVACGALLSPGLLMASGMKSKATGTNLGFHPACRAIGLMETPINGDRAVPQSFHARVPGDREIYLETAFLPPGLMAAALPGFGAVHHDRMRQYSNLAVMGFRIIETRRGRVESSLVGWPRSYYDLCEHDLESIRKGLELSAHILFDAGAREVYIPLAGQEVVKSRDQLSTALASPIEASRLELSGYHLQGTLRMGMNPETSVVNERGRHHSIPGLWVADTSLFPVSSRVNPQHTVMALATLVAQDVVEGWERSASSAGRGAGPPAGAN